MQSTRLPASKPTKDKNPDKAKIIYELHSLYLNFIFWA